MISPLAIRSDHAPGGASTTHFISGSALMGCLAAIHRLLRSEQHTEFEALFLNGAIHYPHLYPASFKAREIQGAGTPVYPLPLTAQSCKRFPGFYCLSDEKNEEKRHGVRDSLFDWALLVLGEEAGYNGEHVLRSLEANKICSYEKDNQRTCNAMLDHFDGYYRRERLVHDPVHRGKADVETRLHMHTGINRERGIVEEGILYSREVIEEGTHFWGQFRVADELADTFQAFTKLVRQKDVIVDDGTQTQTRGLVRIGTGRTRGMGKVTLRCEPREDEQQSEEHRYNNFKQRVQNFDAALRAQAGALASKSCYFALTLHAPVILCDDALRYYGTLDAATLAQQAGLSDTPFKLLYQNAHTRRITGWQELWGTPRTNEYAIDTGSVFLFSCEHAPDDDSWLRPLFEMEEKGLGKRRSEGFGRVYLSDPFHLEVRLA